MYDIAVGLRDALSSIIDHVYLYPAESPEPACALFVIIAGHLSKRGIYRIRECSSLSLLSRKARQCHDVVEFLLPQGCCEC